MARPSKYEPAFDNQAKKLSELGLTDEQMANFFEVSIQTFNTWKGKHPTFLESLKLGKAQPDENVKRSLYQRAIGYSHEEDDIRVVEGAVVITPTIKHYPPDTTACIFWLKNRLPEEFRQNPDGMDNQKDHSITINLVDAKKPDAN